MNMVFIGKKAPEFSLKAYQNGEFKEINLGDYKGRWLVLFFYPRDFTFVCPTELHEFAKHEEEFTKENAAVAAASTDSEHSHKAWFSKDLPDVTYPILADTAHTLSRDYGVFIEESGAALRGTFIIDPEGIVKYIVISDNNVGRSVHETLRVLKALKTGKLCPVEWHEGEKTLN
ncbi:MAG: peroxiredoxin [bacterium]|nr:peroxiredoxin [bacterium]